MLNNIKIPRHMLMATFAGAMVIIFYLQILSGFFQQDEWLGFARQILLEEKDINAFLKEIFVPSTVHYTPLTVLIINLLLSLFGLNYLGYAVVSVVLHTITVVLVFYLARSLFKNNYLALFCSLLFGVSAVGFQATSWVVADIGTHGATIFGLASLILFFNFLSSKKILWFYLTLGLLVLSLLFKEITLGLFVLLPLTFFFFVEKALRKKIKVPLIIVGIGLLYLAFRLIFLFYSPVSIPTALVGSTVSQINTETVMSNVVFMPFKAVAQTIIPPSQILQSSYSLASRFPEKLTGEKGITAFDIFAQGRILPALEFFLFLLAAVLVVLILKKGKDKQIVNLCVFGFLFIIINSVVYVLSPERTGTVAIIDSRNLYFPSIGASIFIIAVLMSIAKYNLKKAFLLLLPILLINIFWLNKELNTLVQVGMLRRSILTQITEAYPDLPEKTVFYTTSNTSYYGLPPEEKIMPFQSGFGQTLLVWYYQTEKWPNGFFENRFLWEIAEQGYREYNGRGFGYFRDFELLQKTIKDYDLPRESVVSFSWDSRYNALVNTTEEIRKSI